MLVHDPEGTFAYSCNCYRGFVSSETARKGYRAFIDLLLEGRERAILWHCTAGKDRAGFAAAIVLALLGVSMDRIFEDYLLQRFHKSDVAHNI